MARHNDSWGIEVGAYAIKAMHLVRTGNDVHLEEYEVLPFKQVLTTPDLNVDEAIQVNLDTLMQRHDMSRSNVVISVPGHLAFARFAKLPPVEPKKIPDIVRFEAVQQIPFPIDQVEWDYQIFQQQDSPDVEVGIFAITKERVMNFLLNYRQVGMRIDALTLSPLAVYNAFAFERDANGDSGVGSIYMDIGTQSTDLIIVENGGIWLRTLPIGGNNFTDALVKAFKLSFSKAEKLKREAGTSKYARQIFQAMRPVFADLVQEMQRSLGYYQSINRDAQLTRLVGVGSTFRLPGLQKFLKQQLQIEVVRPDGFKRIAVDGKDASEFADHALNMATAYGLALQGVGLEAVSANVLPQHILRQRLWRAKQPWIAAAAACVALASGVAATRYFVENASFDAAHKESESIVQPVINRAQQKVNELDSQMKDAGGDPRLRIENLRRILDYRNLWPQILQDVAEASRAMGPQPQLLTPDYQKIKQIPPQARQRFYIQSITSEYQPSASVAGAAAAAGMPPSAQPGAPTDALTGNFSIDTFFAPDRTPPQFVITVKGYTPFGTAESVAVREVTAKFIGYLSGATARNGRPYKLNVDTRSVIVNKYKVNADGSLIGSQRAMVAQRGAYMGGGMQYDVPGGMPGGMPGGAYGRPTVTEPLIPLRPLADETHQATGMEIKWTVQLLRPEEARKAEPRRSGTPAQEQTAPEPVQEPQQPQAVAPPAPLPPQKKNDDQEVSL